jgi:hypothetical protein
MRWGIGLLTCLGIGLAGLVAPTPAHAGGVHLSIGIGIPAPVYVAPPPVVVTPAPVVVYPEPHVIYPPPVVFVDPHPGYRAYHLPPGLAKKSYGYHPAYGYKFRKHHRHDW